MRKHIKNIFSVIFLLSITVGFSQRKENDTLDTGVIDVVKPYVPTISDAFKVKESPTLDDETTDTKKEIQYNIFSFPVASTFTPSKGKATLVARKKRERLYNNYASLGGGSFRTVLGEAYVSHMVSRSETVGGYLSHHSSKGGIEDAVVKNSFSDSKINLNYSTQLRDLSWGIEGGFQHQFYNWYGIPEPIASDNILVYYLDDVGHSFYDAYLGGEVTFEDTYLKSGNAKLQRFFDNNGSSESRIVIDASMDIPVNYSEISTTFNFDYLSGGFDRLYDIDELYQYSNFQFTAAPTFELNEGDFTFNLGAAVTYFNDMEAGEGKFYFYPKILASYRFVDGLLIAYGGVKGGLNQNTYRDFANENSFVSPTLMVSPTNQAYNAFVGLKGKVTNNISYDVSGHYISDKNKALFKANMIKDVSAVYDYEYGNSFGVVYDDVTTFGLSGALNVDLNRNLKLGLKAEYFIYNTDTEAEAWNLPSLNGSAFFDYQIDEHWFAGANLYFMGQRKDEKSIESTSSIETVDVDGYFDINIHGGYRVNEQLSIFIKANNLTNNSYQRWQSYNVQPFQILVGATYKFGI
ncbi:TonB-dependent receptor [Tamlana sp. 2_MG-2023]|uniref:TonB-dependent receptor n=1 Tax=unclassified Tamlana TaxID=2614803 RepID=UPI0026E418A9|nr:MULTISPECIES: TonB-dependent receptor [unclassified Tamlana]MDO6760185.1 TonB-dependent receptor [Tamlana sp. 2_MG-2023]MDO6790117.1 TonB-dependent receptor [Tamlana sp. 1_MG-2023]